MKATSKKHNLRSYDQSVADLLYKNGAQHYICKPADFSECRNIIRQALIFVAQNNIAQSHKENFSLISFYEVLL